MTPEERASAIIGTMALELPSLAKVVHDYALEMIHAALAEEREACATLAEGADIICNIVEDQAARERRATTIDTGRMIASAIRRRT